MKNNKDNAAKTLYTYEYCSLSFATIELPAASTFVTVLEKPSVITIKCSTITQASLMMLNKAIWIVPTPSNISRKEPNVLKVSNIILKP